jgi:hypothetical protein
MQQFDYNNRNKVLLRGSCRNAISKGQSQLRGSSVQEAVKEEFELGAEGSPLLKFIAREWLEKA